MKTFRYIVSLVIVVAVLSIMGWIISRPYALYEESWKYTQTIRGQVNFSGTIYESSQVQPGTFAILKPWNEAERWGKGSILSYQVLHGAVKCTAWFPNEETPGTFLKSEWELRSPWPDWIKSKTVFYPKTGEAVIVPLGISRKDLGGVIMEWGLILVIFSSLLFMTNTGRTIFLGASEIIIHPRKTGYWRTIWD